MADRPRGIANLDLDAFLDLTDQAAPSWEGAVEAARQIQGQVRHKVGLSASLGVATNKLLAKVASDQDKPGGLTVVYPGDEAAFSTSMTRFSGAA